ncbi:hypothetical protein ZIOFF_007699 [Zingiber officinale]|uniref:RNA-directed DNA polymerase n=1 Tax=Zingiber officinale TaxID=94328 RepID=A0A8J5IF49_ZINOF|nr:hypothetical protein ZIOFF_007699 [Zingiber officinale]
MRVSRKEYLCQHDWSYDETTAADCRDCKLEARAGNRIDCRKCKLIICSLCTYHCFKISWPSTIRTQMKKTDWKSLSALQSNLIQKFIRRENELEEEVKNLRQQISGMEELAIIQEAPSEYERELTEVQQENAFLKLMNEKQQKDIEALKQEKQLLLELGEINKRELMDLKTRLLVPSSLPVLTFDEYYVNAAPQRNNLLNIKVRVEINNQDCVLNAILDTGAATCVCDGTKIPKEFRQQASVDALIQGVNGATKVSEILKEGKIWVGEQYFRLPRTFVMPSLAEGLNFILGMNFIRAMEGGLRIEKGEVTFYKLVTTVSTPPTAHQIYSKFDLKSGFHQVMMEPESIPWTAFWAIDGLYEWLVMSFGLKNAPAIFQRKRDNCFRGTEEFIAIYIDDILVFSDTYEAHKRHLKAFITICEQNGLILSPTKYKIGVKQVDFLGATIGDSKIRLQPHIIQKILETKSESLTEIRALRRWLGILNYARAYIPNLGKTLGPLYSKTSVKGERRMNTQDWKIIEQIKQQVQNLPDLEIPPPDAIILLETDGCMEGWGGICKWKTSKGEPRTSEKICAYASGRFLPVKSTIDAEVQAVINSLEKFKIYYLDKSELIIRTDSHAIVKFYEKASDHKPSRVRWLTLSDYISGIGIKVSFEHISGKDNVLADELSRLITTILVDKWEHTLLRPLTKAINEVLQKPNPVMEARMASHISNTLKTSKKGNENPGRHFYKCSTDTCHSWYWADLIENYVQQRLNMEAPLAQEPINWVNIEQHGYWDNDPVWEEPGLGEPEVINDDEANSEIDDPTEDSSLFHQHLD